MKIQDHQKGCRCYYCYLDSPEWEREKQKAWKATKINHCTICGIPEQLEWHHFRGYASIWTENDYRFIVRVCRNCHQRNHFPLFGGKIPLTRKALQKRYKFLKWTYPIRTYRPSLFLQWVWDLYRIE